MLFSIPLLTTASGNEATLAILALLLAISAYFFQAYIHVRIFQKARYDRPWVAYVPFGTLYGKLEVLKKPRWLLLLPLGGYGAAMMLALDAGGIAQTAYYGDILFFYLGTALSIYLNGLLFHRFRVPPILALLGLLPQGIPFLMLFLALLAFRTRYRFNPFTPPKDTPLK